MNWLPVDKRTRESEDGRWRIKAEKVAYAGEGPSEGTWVFCVMEPRDVPGGWGQFCFKLSHKDALEVVRREQARREKTVGGETSGANR